MNTIYVIVPSYNPDKAIMAGFISKLKQTSYNVIIVNDGSDSMYDSFFESFEDEGITVLRHVVNQGKGRAIKTAFNYLLMYCRFDAVITADCDGQHSVEDIIECGLKVIENPNDLILGVRDFNQSDVPKKSWYGNKITIYVFKIFIGLTITDTQTGLRAFSEKTARQFLAISGERYDYETNMLIACKERGIKIAEVPIKTIYINKNQASHFNPIKDSWIIYKLFFKYILVAISSFLIDISLFQIFVWIINTEKRILIATVCARVFSSVFNYKLNGNLIFKQSTKKSMFKYYILVIAVMLVSGYTVTFLSKLLSLDPLPLKILIDGFLFILSFVIQREWVFK